MGRLAHWPVLAGLGVLLARMTVGCGGPEFVAAGSSEDGGVATDGSSPDATSKGDGSSPKDGAPGADGSDSGDGGDAGPAAFACPSPDDKVVFCSGFDKQTTPPWEWASAPTTPKAGETVDTVDYLSPPNGFTASNKLLLAVTDNTQVASLGKPFQSNANSIDYVFHMFVKQYDVNDNPAIPVAQLTIGPSTPAQFSLDLVLKAGELILAQVFTGTDGGVQTVFAPVGPVGTGAWVKVEMLLDRSTANWTVAIAVNNGLKLTTQTAATPSNQSLEVDLGIVEVVPPSTANAITFDNVTVRAY